MVKTVHVQVNADGKEFTDAFWPGLRKELGLAATGIENKAFNEI